MANEPNLTDPSKITPTDLDITKDINISSIPDSILLKNISLVNNAAITTAAATTTPVATATTSTSSLLNILSNIPSLTSTIKPATSIETFQPIQPVQPVQPINPINTGGLGGILQPTIPINTGGLGGILQPTIPINTGTGTIKPSGGTTTTDPATTGTPITSGTGNEATDDTSSEESPKISSFKIEDALKDLLEGLKKSILDLEEPQTLPEEQQPTEEEQKRMRVIADFSLPYRCCIDESCDDDSCPDADELRSLPVPPFAKDDFAVTLIERSVDIPVTFNDNNIPEDAIVLDENPITHPEHGTVTIKHVTVDKEDVVIFNYQPEPGFKGNDLFVYRIYNRFNGLEDTATVWIRVKDYPPATIKINNPNVCRYGGPQVLVIDAPERPQEKIHPEGAGVYFDQEKSQWMFDPKNEAVQRGVNEIKLFQGDEPIASLQITVYAPAPAFEVGSVSQDSTIVSFQLIDHSVDANEWHWVVQTQSGQQLVSDDQNPLFTIPIAALANDPHITVTLSVWNKKTTSQCGVVGMPQVVLLAVTIQHTLILPPNFCKEVVATPFEIVPDMPQNKVVIDGPGAQFDQSLVKWVFHPEDAPKNTQLQFTLKDQNGVVIAPTITTIVYDLKAGCSVESVQEVPLSNPPQYIIGFRPDTTNGVTYDWNINDNFTSSDPHPKYQISLSELKANDFNLKVTLTVKAALGDCSASEDTTLHINIKQEQGAASLSLKDHYVDYNDGVQFIHIDTAGWNFDDLQVNGPGVTYNQLSGQWMFNPQSPDVPLGQQFQLILASRIDGSLISSFDVTVVRAAANYTSSISKERRIINFTNFSYTPADATWTWIVDGVVYSNSALPIPYIQVGFISNQDPLTYTWPLMNVVMEIRLPQTTQVFTARFSVFQENSGSIITPKYFSLVPDNSNYYPQQPYEYEMVDRIIRYTQFGDPHLRTSELQQTLSGKDSELLDMLTNFTDTLSQLKYYDPQLVQAFRSGSFDPTGLAALSMLKRSSDFLDNNGGKIPGNAYRALMDLTAYNLYITLFILSLNVNDITKQQYDMLRDLGAFWERSIGSDASNERYDVANFMRQGNYNKPMLLDFSYQYLYA